jgi:hypothetical protein
MAILVGLSFAIRKWLAGGEMESAFLYRLESEVNVCFVAGKPISNRGVSIRLLGLAACDR